MMALYRFDPEKKTLGELLAAHPQVDLAGGLVYDRTKERVVGVAYNADRPGVAWFDEDWARVAAMVDGALPNHFNVLSRTDGPRALVFSYSDTDPGAYYLLDVDKRKLEILVETRRAIKPDTMPTRQPVRYPARDGLEIPGWLTLPKGTDAKNLPLIVLVHGGPWVHGAGWRWNSEAAFLGSLGYAVLEPEFRGSTGWGWKHYRASFKQWGRAMQDDLDDGMDWLVKQGTVDPKRACIMGASYGGYAVMMGLARDPDRWRCGIDVVGVTDINLMYDVAWSDIANSTFIKYTAKDMLGDQVADAAQLKATSPIAQAARVRSPVLMAYGANDRRVPLIHGEKMRDALRARDVPVEWVVYSGEGHGFLLEANRFDFYRRVELFLDKNLRAPP
jgi:dipeptidyl aminopeptidase/acylaminoacyl peptidase